MAGMTQAVANSSNDLLPADLEAHPTNQLEHLSDVRAAKCSIVTENMELGGWVFFVFHPQELYLVGFASPHPLSPKGFSIHKKG